MWCMRELIRQFVAKGAGIDDDSEKIRFGRDATLEVRMATGKSWS